ncbi:MAG: protein kinase [Candidatus Cohnella colombiensis]|uniref:Protein kinase n=1 Tax=Candidatus Cohnella colombiensis TaxID=3121368 RepID=A0AA95JCV0_9BACL|nr:MAG: protein kinase [Cohnella sp.]
MTTSAEIVPLPPGTMLRGKWNGNSYRLEKLLGLGTNGQVYLAVSNGYYRCAVKLGLELAELQGEANLLASLDAAEKHRKPFLIDVDDAVIADREVPFYVMKYVTGIPVKAYLRKNGSDWMGVIGYRLLERLAQLHEAGRVFGDIKSDNVLVGDYGKVELVDFGGLSEIGRSVRQYTEICDRGYWLAGARTADPAYDWFGVAMMWIHAIDGKRLNQLTKTLLPQNRHPQEVMRLVRSHSKLRRVETWIEKALAGQFSNTDEAAKQWRECFIPNVKSLRTTSRVPRWMTNLLVGSIIVFVSVAALFYLQ